MSQSTYFVGHAGSVLSTHRDPTRTAGLWRYIALITGGLLLSQLNGWSSMARTGRLNMRKATLRSTQNDYWLLIKLRWWWSFVITLHYSLKHCHLITFWRDHIAVQGLAKSLAHVDVGDLVHIETLITTHHLHVKLSMYSVIRGEEHSEEVIRVYWLPLSSCHKCDVRVLILANDLGIL